MKTKVSRVLKSPFGKGGFRGISGDGRGKRLRE
jgi:hypothetical protein